MTKDGARETLLAYRKFTLENLTERWENVRIPANIVDAMITLLVDDDGSKAALASEFPITHETPSGT